MEEKDPMKFSEWVDSLTVSDAASVFLMIAFVTLIIGLIIRTFRNKPSA